MTSDILSENSWNLGRFVYKWLVWVFCFCFCFEHRILKHTHPHTDTHTHTLSLTKQQWNLGGICWCLTCVVLPICLQPLPNNKKSSLNFKDVSKLVFLLHFIILRILLTFLDFFFLCNCFHVLLSSYIWELALRQLHVVALSQKSRSTGDTLASRSHGTLCFLFFSFFCWSYAELRSVSSSENWIKRTCRGHSICLYMSKLFEDLNNEFWVRNMQEKKKRKESKKKLRWVLYSENLKAYDLWAKHKAWTGSQMWFLLVTGFLIKYPIQVQRDVDTSRVIAALFL